MKFMNKISFFFILSLLLTVTAFLFYDKTAKATTTSADYYFVYNGSAKQAGSEIELKKEDAALYITTKNGIASGASVKWESSETDVVTVEKTSVGDYYAKITREGPGYSTITASINDGSSTYTVSCVIKVDLQVDAYNTGLTTATVSSNKILVLNAIDEEKPIYLKYVDYDEDASSGVITGGAIDVKAVTWESDNEGVVTVDSNGKVKAVGSGSTTITATSKTMSTQDKPMYVTVKVVVKPMFSLTLYDSEGNDTTYPSVGSENTLSVVAGVATNFVIESKAVKASDLIWRVYDCSTDKMLDEGTSVKMTYSVSDISGNVHFTNVKAGTYKIYAFADDEYNVSTNAPYAYMKIIVPIDIGDQNIIMNVDDTYSIFDNANIPSAGIFKYEYKEGNANIASIDPKTSTITAVSKGRAIFRLTYIPNSGLYDSSIVLDPIDISVTVIDGISLSTTSATIYTKGTLQIDAILTDSTKDVTWSSSDTSIATVDKGLVTGVKAGTAVITAKQTVNGIVKKATCTIVVQQSVTSIAVDPSAVTLAIKGYTTLAAKITPSNLSGVNLKWKSSNESVVKITEASALSATIQGVAGGTAVISAINQDNVVVGYCHVTVQQPVTSIVLSETSVTVDLNTTRLQLRANVYPGNASNQTVIWSSTDTTKATVDSNGSVKILKPGTVSIIATSEDDPAVKAICNITISIPVSSVVLDESTKTMYVGQAARLTYTLLPVNASNSTVSWISTNTSVATVDSTGYVTAKGVGTTVVILKALESGTSVYCTITVKRVATGVKFDVSTLDLEVNEYYYIKTTMTPKDSTDTELVWESSDKKVAIVDDSGKVTGKGAGIAIISARTEAGGTTYCKVTVTLPVDGLLLNFSDKTIYTGEKFDLEVSVSPSKATDLDVTWKSSNTAIAKVSDKGEVTGLIGGVAVITCTTVDGGYSATCVVTVRESVTSIKLNYETYNLGVKKTVKLEATVSNETASNQKVSWSSSNEKVATVNQKGKVTGVSVGYATITATSTDGSEVEASCEIRVVVPATSFTISDTSLSMLVGEVERLTAKITPSNATFKKAKWSSSDETVAIVDDDGSIIAVKAGTTIITAETQDNAGKKAICYVTVYERVASTGITLQDKKLVMVPGESKTVQLVLIPAASTDGYTWSSDNSAVAKVDKKTGRITARATGTAYITVMTDSGKTSTVEVTVIGLNVTELVLEQYTSYPYKLEVEGAESTVKWSIDNQEIAQVSNGYISTRAVGTATITATVNGRKLNCKLKVVKIGSMS